ncbi:hypothetical protein C1I98_37680, partial [Spongiactinospora gelatinilytica]
MGRVGKILSFVSGALILIELVGADKLARYGKFLERLYVAKYSTFLIMICALVGAALSDVIATVVGLTEWPKVLLSILLGLGIPMVVLLLMPRLPAHPGLALASRWLALAIFAVGFHFDLLASYYVDGLTGVRVAWRHLTGVRGGARVSRWAGVLVIVGVVAGLFSVVPVLEEPGYFGRIAAHEGQILAGAGAQLVMIPAGVGFALCLYPALRAVNEALSLGFVGFRVIAAGFHFVGVISLPLFLVPEQEAATIEILRVGRDLVNHVAVIVSLGLGDVLLFFMLYRARLVPWWLSVWGLAGAG